MTKEKMWQWEAWNAERQGKLLAIKAAAKKGGPPGFDGLTPSDRARTDFFQWLAKNTEPKP